MSLSSTRAALAAAVDLVPGVTGHETRPVPLNTGDAWPVMGPGERNSGDSFEVTWAVRVFVPQDELAAAAWWDEHWAALYWALQPVMHVDRFAPVALGDQLAYEITGRAEE